MQKYIIQDWAGNHLFREKVFDSYEDGWDFLYVTFPDVDEDLSDYFVIPKK